jgi:hypothetical protein
MNTYWDIFFLLLSIVSLLVSVLTTVFAWVATKRHSSELLLRELQLEKLKLEMERSKREIEIDAKNLDLRNAELIVELLTGND